jgi:hypothetical protein
MQTQGRDSELDKGIQQYKDSNPEEAIQILQSVVVHTQDQRERALGYFFIGCAHLGLGELAKTQKAFRQVLHTKPDFQIEEAEKALDELIAHSSNLRKHKKIAPLFAKAQEDWTAFLTVEVFPPQAQIQINGQTMGSGTIKRRVFVGTHTVVAMYQGQKVQKSVKLNGDEQKTLTIDIPPVMIHNPPSSTSVGQPIVLTIQLVSQMIPYTVDIYYTLDNVDWQDETMRLTGQSDSAFRTYEATLPSQSHVGTLRYYILATYPRDVQVQSPDELEYHQIKIIDTTPPLIETTPIQRARINEPVIIKAHIQDNTSVERAEVYYADSQAPADFQRLSLVQTSPGEYEATIPPQSIAGQILYYLVATDEGNNVSYYPTEGAKAPLRFPIIDDAPAIQATVAEIEKVNNQTQKKREEITNAIQQVKSQIKSAVTLAQAYQYEQAKKVLADAQVTLNDIPQQANELSTLLLSVTEVAEKGRLAVTFPESRDQIDAKAESLKKVMQQANDALIQSLSETQADLEQTIDRLESSGGLELRITVNNKIVSKPIKVSMECLPQTLEKILNRPLKIDNLPLGTHNIHIELSHWLTEDIQVTIEKNRFTTIYHNFRSGALRVQIPNNNAVVYLDEQPPNSVEENNVAVFEYVNNGKHQLTVVYPDGLSQQKEVDVLSPSPVTVNLPLPKKKEVIPSKSQVPSTKTSLPPETGVGALELRITPTHAAIFLDDKPVGYGSRAFPRLSAGWHTITVKAEGYRSQQIMVNIQAGTILRRSITLSYQ